MQGQASGPILVSRLQPKPGRILQVRFHFSEDCWITCAILKRLCCDRFRLAVNKDHASCPIYFFENIWKAPKIYSEFESEFFEGVKIRFGIVSGFLIIFSHFISRANGNYSLFTRNRIKKITGSIVTLNYPTSEI